MALVTGPRGLGFIGPFQGQINIGRERMTSGKRWLCRALVLCVSAAALAVAQDKSTVSTAVSADGNQTQDIATLRAMIAAQQKQLDALKQALDNQQKVLDQAVTADKTAAQKTAPPSVGQVAS